MSNKLFGTDGVRGVANSELTCELAFRIGEALVKFAGANICIGRDTRQSSIMLESSLAAGIMSAGGTAHCAGVIPTPAVALLVTQLKLDGGIVISASHNPPEYNGIKLFSNVGMKLPDAIEDEIADYVLQGASDPSLRPTGMQVGTIHKIKDARERYIQHAISTISGDLSGLKIAVDCAHGAACKTTPEALRRLGADVVCINDDYDSAHVNVACGSTCLDKVKELVLREHADLGLAHDGDADRVLFVDQDGNEVDGDYVLAICGNDMMQRGALKNNEIVSTVMCNLGFSVAMKDLDIDVVQTAVGDRYVLERMIADGAVIGGEQSGHIIFLEHNSTGDGLITALQLLSVVKHSGKSLKELREVMTRYPQELINVRVASKDNFADNDAISRAIADAEADLSDKGRVLVRASGTEPLIRVMVEAQTHELAQTHAQTIAQVVEVELA